MPSLITHPVVPLAIGLGLGSRLISKRLLAAGVALSIAPDIDVYTEQVSSFVTHRGITHTLWFAALCGTLAALFARALDAPRLTAFLFVTVCTASHGFLDAFTNGGAGIPFFSPFDDARYFMPVRVIELSPLGITAFFSERGLDALASELTWVWPPAIALGATLYFVRRALARRVP